MWDDGGSDLGQRTNNDYITVTNAGAVGGSGRSGDWDGFIRSAQGFFIKATVAGEVHFTPDMIKSDHNSGQGFFRKDTDQVQKFKLRLSNSRDHSEILIGFDSDATEGFDRNLDGVKLKGDGVIKLYTLIQETPMAIQVLPLPVNAMAIPLRIQTTVAGEYVLSITESDLDAYEVAVFDKYSGKTIRLTPETPHSITFSKGLSDRFDLIVSPYRILSTSDLDQTQLQVTNYGNKLSIQNIGAKDARVSIYDFSGSLIKEFKSINIRNGEWSTDFDRHGLFILNIQTDNQLVTHKFAH